MNNTISVEIIDTITKFWGWLVWNPYCLFCIFTIFIVTEPPAPSIREIWETNATSINLGWSAPDPPHGIIKRYHIMYWKTAEDSRSTNNTKEVDGRSTQYSMIGLSTFTNYSIQVQSAWPNAYPCIRRNLVVEKCKWLCHLLFLSIIYRPTAFSCLQTQVEWVNNQNLQHVCYNKGKYA